MTNRKSKPIVFSENENKLLQWAENQDKPFGSYVKDLIRADLKKHEQYKKDEIRDIVKEILREFNIDKNELVVTEDSGPLGNKGKKAYKNLLKNIR